MLVCIKNKGIHENKENNIVHNQQFMGEEGKLKSGLAQTTEEVFSKIGKKRLLIQTCLTKTVNKIPITYCKFEMI